MDFEGESSFTEELLGEAAQDPGSCPGGGGVVNPTGLSSTPQLCDLEKLALPL